MPADATTSLRDEGNLRRVLGPTKGRNAALDSLGVYSVGLLATKTEILAEMYARFCAAILSRGGEGFVPPKPTASSYTKKLGFSITLALLLCVVLIAPAFARDCHLARFDVQMSVARDGV